MKTMSIYIKKSEAESLEVVAGLGRLQAMLAVNGKATVEDTATGEKFEVHMVEGRLQIMTDEERESLMREGRKWNAGVAQAPKKKAAPFYRQFAKSKY